MRYLVQATDSESFEEIVDLLDDLGVRIFLKLAGRNLLSTDQLSADLIQELAREHHARVAPEEQLEPDEPRAANA